MTSFLARHWKTIAITSVSLTSTYLYSHYDHSQFNNHVYSSFIVQAAEYERRNQGKIPYTSRIFARKKNLDDDEDDDEDDENDDEDKKDEKDQSDKPDEIIKNTRARRFYDYASVEYNGEIYMTPVDFLESIIADRPRPRINRRQLTDEMVESMLYNTPPKHRGSKNFFRSLEDEGLISFTEYLFLWIILTKPATQFHIAFTMFDTDGNQLVDKHEFLMLGKAMSDKRMSNRSAAKHSPSKSTVTQQLSSYFNLTDIQQVDTTLLLHFFGKNGRDTLNYAEFKRFMENFQIELLEIEFNAFSHGFKKISDLDFAEILLRYTEFNRDAKKAILKRVKKTSTESSSITFEQFHNFFTFLNNLDEFNIAMRFHQLSNKPISQAEFQRAVKISTGFELDPHMIGLLFRIFDADGDQHLSYDEFMAVMKGRLSRGFETSDYGETSSSKFEQFKRCFRDLAKKDKVIAST